MSTLSELCAPGKRIDVVIDTDAFNEIDDQFAVIWALLSPDRFRVRAIHAAPFENKRVASFGEGMERSYEEILRLLDLLNLLPGDRVKRGALSRVGAGGTEDNPAVDNLLALMGEYSVENPLFVVAIGAITNVAEALRRRPEVADRIVLLWLGGHPSHWAHNWEFNLRGDPEAVRVIMASSVRLVWFPCAVVAESLTTTLAEMRENVEGWGPLGDYLFRIFRTYEHENLAAVAASKTIWDLAPFAWLLDNDWANTKEMRRPQLDADLKWLPQGGGAPAVEVIQMRRDPIFRDLFLKLPAFANGSVKPDFG